MKNIIVSGSVAYDYIMNYNWKFKNDINAENIENLSVWFLIQNLQKEMWWTWLNIAYNLSLLWEKPILLSAIWKDFGFDWFFKEKINLNYIHKSKKLLSASWYIISDSDSNQITAFYPWSMEEAIETSIEEIIEEISYSIISPNQKIAMLKHLKESKEKNIKTFFDPGQQILSFSKEELEEAIINANYLIVNEYEFNEFKTIIKKEKTELFNFLEKIIITKWSKWSIILWKNESIEIPSVKVDETIDPTWAGDAYRAWLIRWLKLWYDWLTSWELWSLLASHCVRFHWWQSHYISKANLQEEYKDIFNKKIDLFKEEKTIIQ